MVEYEKDRKERMRDELKELNARVQELHEFLGHQSLVSRMPTDKLDLLMKQYHYMTMYEHVLRLRLNMEDEDDGS